MYTPTFMLLCGGKHLYRKFLQPALNSGFCITLLAGGIATAQRTPATAVKRADIQVGGGFAIARPDYSQAPFLGGSLYATYDFSSHLGVEFMFHQVNTRQQDHISERTYELGPRYMLHYGALEPYVRLTYGRGVFNYPDSVANLAYNMVTVAGGADVRLTRHVYARGEYEVQRWFDFPSNGLQPTVVTLGAAYRF